MPDWMPSCLIRAGSLYESESKPVENGIIRPAPAPMAQLITISCVMVEANIYATVLHAKIKSPAATMLILWDDIDSFPESRTNGMINTLGNMVSNCISRFET